MWRLGKSRRWPGDFKRILPYSQGPGPDVGLWGSIPALTPCQIREKLSPPINFSVSFSHPCCEGVWGSWMGPTTASSPPTLLWFPLGQLILYVCGKGGVKALCSVMITILLIIIPVTVSHWVLAHARHHSKHLPTPLFILTTTLYSGF